MTTQTKAQIIEQIRSMTAKETGAVAPAASTVARWKDGTPRTDRDRLTLLESVYDNERAQEDMEYALSHMDEQAKILSLRSKIKRTEDKAAVLDARTKQAAAKTKYDEDQRAAEAKKKSDTIAERDAAIEKHFETGGRSPLPHGDR